MSLYKELDYSSKIREIVGVQFSILSPEEIKKAYSTYAPRYGGDDEYDVGKLIADHKLRRKEKR